MNSHNLAQIAAVSSSIWLSGEIFTYSWGAVPAVLEACSTSQHLAAKQWATFYHKGHSLGPPFAILGAGGFIWLALKSGCWLYWGAAILDIGIVPYTFAFMVQTNSRIFEFANVKDSPEKPASEENQLAPLLNRWACLNTVRSLFPLAGGILGLVAALC
jgi:noranthrone monooxygenase